MLPSFISRFFPENFQQSVLTLGTGIYRSEMVLSPTASRTDSQICHQQMTTMVALTSTRVTCTCINIRKY